MWRMVQQDRADDCVIGAGDGHLEEKLGHWKTAAQFSDAWWARNKLTRVVQAMATDPSAGIVGHCNKARRPAATLP